MHPDVVTIWAKGGGGLGGGGGGRHLCTLDTCLISKYYLLKFLPHMLSIIAEETPNFMFDCIYALTLSMCGKISADNVLKYFPRKLALTFHANCLNLHEMSKPFFWER